MQVTVGHDEREQTLNQLLVAMDGFTSNAGVILLAATNRPEVLDKAFLRPGRFDRQLVVDAADLDRQISILEVHSRGRRLADEVSLRRIAQITPGFSSADLANTVNEAALLAARRGDTILGQSDLQDAVEKVIAGPERRSRRISEDEKRRVAHDEAGHALVAAFGDHSNTVHKISIIPRGRAALDHTLNLPDEDQFLATRSELFDRIIGPARWTSCGRHHLRRSKHRCRERPATSDRSRSPHGLRRWHERDRRTDALPASRCPVSAVSRRQRPAGLQRSDRSTR